MFLRWSGLLCLFCWWLLADIFWDHSHNGLNYGSYSRNFVENIWYTGFISCNLRARHVKHSCVNEKLQVKKFKIKRMIHKVCLKRD